MKTREEVYYETIVMLADVILAEAKKRYIDRPFRKGSYYNINLPGEVLNALQVVADGAQDEQPVRVRGDSDD